MKNRRSVRSCASALLAGALLTACLATPAAAQSTPAPAPDPQAPATPPAPTPEEVAKKQDATTMDFFRSIEMSGFVDTYYTYNFNTPSKPCATVGGVAIFNCLHNFDVAHNSFSLNMAKLALEKKPTADSRGGFRIDLAYGSAPEIIAGSEPGGTSAYQNIEQAYLSYMAPTKKGSLQLDFGKFVTPIGFEVIESKDNWNYSRGLLFAAAPYYHMGMRAVYSPSDKFTLTGFLLNGWNDVVDNNTGKSIGLSISGKPTPALTLTENYIGGPELPNDNSDWRHLSDTVVAYTVNPKVSAALNYDYGHETTSQWQGIALYLRLQPNAWFAFSPRYEYFQDRNGWASGTAQNVQDFTLTAEFKHKDGVVMRVEYRGDMSNTAYFIQDETGTVKNQNVLTFAWIYAFTTKAQ